MRSSLFFGKFNLLPSQNKLVTIPKDAGSPEPPHNCNWEPLRPFFIPCSSIDPAQRPSPPRMSGVSAYLMLMDGESLRRIGKGSGLDLVAASKSWIARHALCAKGLGRAGKGWAGGVGQRACNGARIFSDGTWWDIWHQVVKVRLAWFIWCLLRMNPAVVEIRASPFEAKSIALWSRGRIWTWSERLIKTEWVIGSFFFYTPSISNVGGLYTITNSFLCIPLALQND